MKDEFESSANETSSSSPPTRDEFAATEIYNPVGVSRTWLEWATDGRIRRPRGFLRDDVFVRTEMSMIYGPGGSGKSYLALYVGICVAMEFPVHTMKTSRGNVLFLSEEMTNSVIHERCRRMLSTESASEMGDKFHIRCQSEFNFSEAVLRSQKKLELIIEEVRAELVFVDCLADVHHSDENSNQEMGGVMKSIRAVARTTGACIVVVHHMGKPGEDGKSKGARGASVMKDSCESMIEVKPMGVNGEPRSLVQFLKARHVVGRIPAPFEFAQFEDPNRLVNVADPDEPEMFKPGMIFSFGKHVEAVASDADVMQTRQVVAQLVEAHPDGVPVALVKGRLCNAGLSARKASEAIHRATALGLVVLFAGGRKLTVPSS